MSPFTVPVLPIIISSPEIFPSICPWISTTSASIDPVIDPVSLTIISLDKTGPLIKPETSIAPELLIVPSMLTVSLISDLSESFSLFFLSPNIYFK